MTARGDVVEGPEEEVEEEFDQGMDVLKVLRPRIFAVLRSAGRRGERMYIVVLILEFGDNIFGISRFQVVCVISRNQLPSYGRVSWGT